MKNTLVIKIDEKEANALERANHELNFTKDVIQRLIETHQSDAEFVKSEAFRQYQREGAELQAEYNLLSDAISKKYIPEYLQSHECSWIMQNGYITIAVKCRCGIEELAKHETK